jgi:hypothetical protein
MTALARDLRLAVRALLGAQIWTLVVLLSLALGIGVNTALFTAVNGLLLQSVARSRARAPRPVQPCRPQRYGPELERLRLLGAVGHVEHPIHVLLSDGRRAA